MRDKYHHNAGAANHIRKFIKNNVPYGMMSEMSRRAHTSRRTMGAFVNYEINGIQGVNIDTIEAFLNVMGYTLKVVKK